MQLAKIRVVEDRHDEACTTKASNTVQALLMNTSRVPPDSAGLPPDDVLSSMTKPTDDA